MADFRFQGTYTKVCHHEQTLFLLLDIPLKVYSIIQIIRMYSKSLFIEQVGLYKGRMFAVKDCYGSQMMDITRDIKKELKVRGYCSKVYGRN